MSAVAQSAERTPSGVLRVRLAVVRAIVDELERSLDEFDQTLQCSVGQQLAEELAYLARAFRPPFGGQVPAPNGGNANQPPPSNAPGTVLSLEAAVGARRGREDDVLTFAGFRLDLSEERLWKGDREVRLRRKPCAILCYLVKHPHRVVSQSELAEAVWGKIAMSDSLVRTQVGALRHVIGYRLIETVVGRGYRFVADVDRCEGRALSSETVEAPGGRGEHEPRLGGPVHLA